MTSAFRLRRGFGGRVVSRPSAVVSRPSAIVNRRSATGQTPTEYLMIAGIMTAIGILVLLWMYQPWRKTAQDVADCVREDDCEATSSQ